MSNILMIQMDGYEGRLKSTRVFSGYAHLSTMNSFNSLFNLIQVYIYMNLIFDFILEFDAWLLIVIKKMAYSSEARDEDV